jgi:tetratricopeptide (TPR) repeat protein
MVQTTRNICAAAAFVLAVSILSCSGSKDTGKATTEPSPQLSAAEQANRDRALQHFVDGSVYESKGEYAQAILEYQDALRYDRNHAILYALSKCYSRLNKHTLAIDAGKEAVRLAPDKLEYRRTLADAYIAAYELDSAAAQYEHIVKRDSNTVDLWYSLARLYQSRKPLKALEVYERIIERFGDDWDVLLQIAEIYNSMGQFEKAAGALKKMLATDPSNSELKSTVAQTYIRAQKYDEALALLRELNERYPETLEYIESLAVVHVLRKEYGKAGEYFNTLIANDSVGVDAKLRIGEVYFGQMEKDSTVAPLAIAMFEEIKLQHPQDWRPYWFLGAIGAITRNDSLIIPNFRKVTELAGWNADGWVYLSSAFLEKNDFQEVVTVLEAALRVLPDDFRVNFFLGVAYSRLSRNADAVRVLEHARALDPKDLNAISQLALVYDGMKKYEESDSLYEEALRLDPNNHLVLNNYGYSLAERDLQLQRALDMATRAVTAQPDNSSYLDTIGWVYYKLGNYKEAEKYINKSIEKGDASAVVYEHLGDVYYMMNDKERALEQWKVALKIDSSNTVLQQKVARGTL